MANAQDVVLSEDAKEYQRKKLIAFDYFRKIYGNPELLPDAIKAYEDVFKLNIRARYPDYKQELTKELTKTVCENLIIKTQELQQWTKEKILLVK